MNIAQNVLEQAIDPSSPLYSLKALNIRDFLSLEIPPKENILAPILQTQSLSMLYAKRGVGKTHVALGIAYAVASGGSFLKWTAGRPRNVLYLDGEMPAHTMQERLRRIVQSEEVASPEFFQLITPDMQDFGMPDLSTLEGQETLEPFTEKADFIIVDNLATLMRSGKENEAQSWLPIQDWSLRHRSKGKSILFIHHSGKTGAQRGTSAKEDVLDLVISLKHPEDYSPAQGARFEIHFEKTRHLIGPDTNPFEASLGPEGWIIGEIKNSDLETVIQLKAEGYSYAKISKETGISRSRAQRMFSDYEARQAVN